MFIVFFIMVAPSHTHTHLPGQSVTNIRISSGSEDLVQEGKQLSLGNDFISQYVFYYSKPYSINDLSRVNYYKIKLSFVENLPGANLAIVLTFLKICAVNDCIQCKQFTENWFHFKHMKIYE